MFAEDKAIFGKIKRNMTEACEHSRNQWHSTLQKCLQSLRLKKFTLFCVQVCVLSLTIHAWLKLPKEYKHILNNCNRLDNHKMTKSGKQIRKAHWNRQNYSLWQIYQPLHPRLSIRNILIQKSAVRLHFLLCEKCLMTVNAITCIDFYALRIRSPVNRDI